jgi:iron complex transport system substrate-binding protein
MTRWPFATLIVLFAALALSACGGDGENSQDSKPAASFPLTITQGDGQQLTLERPPQRIVSLAAHATEILCAIGAGGQLVAVERFANCPLESKAKAELDAFLPNLEAIAGYRPDLVYAFSGRNDSVPAMRRVGLTVLYLELPDTLEGVFEHIDLFGRLSGHSQEAQALVKSMRQRLDAVKGRLADVSRGPRIFHELSDDYYSAGPNSFVGDFYTFLKAQNIAAGAATAYPQLSEEVIIQRDPEVIVLADEDAGVTVESVRSRSGWRNVAAVRNNRICVIDADVISRPGPRIVDALEALAKCLYPQRFG